MRLRFLPLLLFCCAAVVSSVFGDDTDITKGEVLRRYVKIMKRIAANGDNAHLTPDEDMLSVAGSSYIRGMANAGATLEGVFGSNIPYAIPAETTPFQLAATIDAFLTKHPDSLTISSMVVIPVCLAEAYPNPKFKPAEAKR